MIVIELCRDGWTNGLQLSISEEDQDGVGDGYRLWGPKFNGSSELLHRHVIDERDAREIRAYLDREFPEHRLPAPSPESIQGAAVIAADLLGGAS